MSDENKTIDVWRMYLEPYDTNPLILSKEQLPTVIYELETLDEEDGFVIRRGVMSEKDFNNLKEHAGW